MSYKPLQGWICYLDSLKIRILLRTRKTLYHVLFMYEGEHGIVIKVVSNSGDYYD
jgi:hypothetical protein